MLNGYEDRLITPAMPPCMARFCCALNFVIPGTGTMVAGFAVFCCSKNEDMEFGDKCSSCCCSIFIGILQMILTAFLLIGWCWSIVWANYYVEMSETYYSKSESTSAQTVVTMQPTPSIDRPPTSPTVIVQPNAISTPPYSPARPPPTYGASTGIGGWQYHRFRTWRQNTETPSVEFQRSASAGGSPIEVESPPLYEVLYPSRP